MSQIDSDIFFFSEWSHPDPSQVLFYNTILKVNDSTLHNTTVSQNNSFCDFQLQNEVDRFSFMIHTVGICGGMSEYQMEGSFNSKNFIYTCTYCNSSNIPPAKDVSLPPTLNTG